MKTFKLIVGIILILMLAVSCKTAKPLINSSTESKVEVKTSTNLKKDSTAKTDESLNTTTKQEVKEATTIWTQDVMWSAPDSIGKQYPVKSTTKIVGTNKDTKVNSNSTTNKKQEQTLNVEASTKSDSKSVTNTDIKEKPNSTPGIYQKLRNIFISILVLVVLFLGFRYGVFQMIAKALYNAFLKK